MIVADPNSEKNLTKTAQDTLQRIDKLVADNSDSLGAAISNLKTFSAALARNSDRVDGLMAGPEKMTGGGPAKPTPQLYDLLVPKIAPWSGAGHPQILVADTTAVIALQTQRLLARTADGQLSPLGEIQWSDTLPKMLQEKILQSLQDAGVSATLIPPSNPKPEDRQLQIDLRSFDVALAEPSTATIACSATITSGEGKILNMKVFMIDVSNPTGGGDAGAVKSLGLAFGKAMNDLSTWMMSVS